MTCDWILNLPLEPGKVVQRCRRDVGDQEASEVENGGRYCPDHRREFYEWFQVKR